MKKNVLIFLSEAAALAGWQLSLQLLNDMLQFGVLVCSFSVGLYGVVEVIQKIKNKMKKGG